MKKEKLAEYAEKSMQLHYDYAKLRLMMEYDIFYEMVLEGTNPYIETAKDITATFNGIIEEILADKESEQAKEEEWKQKLLALREDVTEKMDVLTAYVDQFVIFEYVLNRVQYRFEEKTPIASDEEFTRQLIQYIFQSDDNVVVNENIHAVLGQLPVRMSREHFFDQIRQAISLYVDSDLSSLNDFLYMLRTNAMIYKAPKMDKHFTEFKPVIEELSSLKLDEMTKEMYAIYAEKINNSASRLNDISDLYMVIQQLINEACSMVIAGPYVNKNDDDAQTIVLKGINALFLEKDSEVFHTAGAENLKTEEEKLCWLAGYFEQIEGLQEQLIERLNMTEAVLDETRQAQKDTIEESNLTKQFQELYQLGRLNTTSAFASLEEPKEEEKVTKDMAKEEAAKLITEMKEKFIASNRMVRRAIMANVLEKLPLFFQTSQEVADYIGNAFYQCDDEAEKYASKQLLEGIMQ